MRRFYFTFCLVLFGFSSLSYAQFLHKFTQTASINDGGEAIGVAVAEDGTVFLAKGVGGLWAYNYDGTSFTNTTHIVDSDSGYAGSMAFAEDGTIFLANDLDGLRAYEYGGSSFTNIAHIDDGRFSAADVEVAADGTIFLAQGIELRAYKYIDTNFTNTGHITCDEFWPWRLAVASDNTVFVAGRGSVVSWGGLWAYSYDGSSFIKTAQVDDTGSTLGVAVAEDGTVFRVGNFNLLVAYSYKDTSFTNITNVEIGNTREYKDVVVAADGTVFIANADDGLRAYSYDGSSFTLMAHINDGGEAVGVAVGADSTVFLAAGEMGLIAYKYSGYVTGFAGEPSILPASFSLDQNYPNPFNPTTIINYDVASAGHVELKVYNQLGQEIGTLVNSMKQIGSHQVVWEGKDNQGNVVSSGVYFYQLKSSSFMQTRKMLFIR